METNEKRIKQIDWSIIAIIVLIFVLIHSIYLLTSEKKELLGEEVLTDEEFVVNAIWNRLIATGIVLLFLVIAIINLKDLLNNNESTEYQIKDQSFRIIVLGLALISVLIEDYLGINNYILIKQQENSYN